MKISIITAVLNRVDTISSSIESVHSQVYDDLEHIIQDGGSTDGTTDVIRRLAGSRSTLVSERDSGIYDAINRGIKRAKGDVIGLMHSDDIFADRFVLANVAKAFVNHDVDGVYGDLVYVSANDSSRVVRYWRSGHYSRERLNRGWMPPHPTLFLRRAVFDRLGLYDTEFRIAADYEAILRFLVSGGISLAYLPQVLVRMRVGGESNGSFLRILLKSREDLCAIRRYNIGGFRTLALKNFKIFSQVINRVGLDS